MEIIQNKKTMKIISVLILMVMLIGIITPVFAAGNNAETLKISRTSKTVRVGKNIKEIFVTNKTGKDVTWSSSDHNIITNLRGYPESGYIKFDAVGVGTATLTATAGSKKVTCEVTVKEAFNFDFSNLWKGGEDNKKTPELPSGGGTGEALSTLISTTFTGVTKLITSDEAKNAASGLGDIIMNFINSLLEGLRSVISNIKQFEFPKGTDLPAETTGGESDENKTVEVTSVTISGATSVKVGEEITLTATVKPNNATNKTVTWSSSSNAATVGKDSGIVKGVTAGQKVTITATAANGKTDTHEISVVDAQQDSGGGSTGTNGITKTVTQEYINSLSKVNLSGYFGGGKYNLTRFNDSGGAFGVQRSQLNYDNTNKWYTYNGKIAVAAAMKRPSWVRSGYDFRSDIYHFGEYEKLYIKINNIWYEAIVVDVCGVSMNPNEKSGNYYDDGHSTNHSCQVIDIWAKSGFSNKYGVEVAIPK